MSKRRVVEVPGLRHKNAIPMASRIGPILVTGTIPETDPVSGQTPPDIESQCAIMFANIRRIIEAAGGTTDDIIKVDVWIRDASYKAHVNHEWLRMFPDEASRPARHTFTTDDLPQPGYLIQGEITAVLGSTLKGET